MIARPTDESGSLQIKPSCAMRKNEHEIQRSIPFFLPYHRDWQQWYFSGLVFASDCLGPHIYHSAKEAGRELEYLHNQRRSWKVVKNTIKMFKIESTSPLWTTWPVEGSINSLERSLVWVSPLQVSRRWKGCRRCTLASHLGHRLRAQVKQLIQPVTVVDRQLSHTVR